MSLQYPNLNVRVIVERPVALLSMLIKREVDVMVGDTRVLEDTRGLDITNLPQYPVCFVCRASHPYAKRKRMALKQIFDYPVATPWVSDMIYEMVALETGIPVEELTAFDNGLIECSYFELLIDVVLNSNAIGCGLESIFVEAIYRKSIVQLPMTHSDITSEFGFITLENYSLSPAIQILRQIIAQTLSEMHDAL